MTKHQLLRHPATAVRAPVIAITMGDPGGIGPEVVVKCLKRLKRGPRCRYIVIGSQAVFSFLNKQTSLDFSFQNFLPMVVFCRRDCLFWDIGGAKFDNRGNRRQWSNGNRAISIASDLAKEVSGDCDRSDQQGFGPISPKGIYRTHGIFRSSRWRETLCDDVRRRQSEIDPCDHSCSA